MPDPIALIAIDVGNSRTGMALFKGTELAEATTFDNDARADIVSQAVSWWSDAADTGHRAIVMGQVNAPVADQLQSALNDQLGEKVYRIVDDLPIPIGTQLDPETLTGQDRLLNAAAAYDQVKQACIVVDAGTAITVDLVDGEGTFHGGAIAPGATMQLKMLNERTVALPDIPFEAPSEEAIGRSTADAMIRGVFHGIRGMVQRLVENYAAEYGAYPLVIATGGDAHTLFDDEELIDRVVPNLTLTGIAVAARHALALDNADDEPGLDIETRPN